MNALILLVFAADPTGLQAAFQSAETVDMTYDWTGFKVTLVNPETIRKLSALVEVKGEARNFPAGSGFSTREIIRLTLRGKKETRFWIGGSFLVYGEKLFTPADDKLWVALRVYFEPPLVEPPKVDRIPGPLPDPPTIEAIVAKTFAAAMKASDKLEVTYRGVKMDYPLGNEPAKEQVLGFLKLAGDVTSNVKKPDNPVEIVFVNKERRIPIYLVGDTAYWGDERWKSVKLSSHTLWRQMVGIVPTPESIGLKPKPDEKEVPKEEPDPTGLKAAIKAAEAMRVNLPSGSNYMTVGGDFVAKSIPPVLIKGEIGPVVKKDAGAKVIEIVLTTGKKSVKYLLIRGPDADSLVFGEKQATLADHELWKRVSSGE